MAGTWNHCKGRKGWEINTSCIAPCIDRIIRAFSGGTMEAHGCISQCSSEVFRAESTLVDYVDEPIFV